MPSRRFGSVGLRGFVKGGRNRAEATRSGEWEVFAEVKCSFKWHVANVVAS